MFPQISLADRPTPFLNLFNDVELIFPLCQMMNGSEIASFVQFLLGHGRVGPAIRMVEGWIRGDDEVEVTISDDGAVLTASDEITHITVTDPEGVEQHLIHVEMCRQRAALDA